MVYLSKIYTKTGDQGQTGLGDGSRVEKDDPRVDAMGDVDELNCVLGVVSALAPAYAENALLRAISNDLFDLGADLCIPLAKDEPPGAALRITPGQVERLETQIDRVNADLSPLNSFILPGGAQVAALLHQARAVCRRAERKLVTLGHKVPLNAQALIYLNRLSDLLFVLARQTNDNGKSDVLWIPGKNR